MNHRSTPNTLARIGAALRRGSQSLLVTAALLGLAAQAGAQTYSLNNTWSILSATNNNLDTSADNRGLAYAGSSNGTPVNLVIVNNKGTHAIYAYDGGTGAFVTSVNSNNLANGNFTLNKIGVTSAGKLLGANLNTVVAGGGAVKIYTWGDWSQPALNAYTSAAGDPLVANLAGARIGDSFAMTGSGTNTLLLFTVAKSNYFALYSTTDGVTFTPSVFSVPAGLPAQGSGVEIGYAFYTNNTFMIAPDGTAGKMYLVQYPANFASLGTNLGTATVIATNSSLPAGNWFDFSYSAATGLLALHPNTSTPISLYSLPTNNFNTLALLATTNLSFATSTTINGNETGDIALGGTNLIATLDTSAGVQGTAISFVAAPLAPSISAAPVGGSVYTNLGSYTFSVSASGTQPLHFQWQYNTVSNLATATSISGATNSSYTITPLTTSASGWYDVLINNAGGSTNSDPVDLEVTVALTNVSVTQLWSLAADNSEPYLDTSYNTRGLAFDPTTLSVLVAEHSAAQIYALDATNNGALKFQVTGPTTGLPAGSIFPLGQVGVADDGVLYCCNVSSYEAGQQSVPADFFIARFQYVAPYTNADGTAPNSTNGPTQAFAGDPGNALVGSAGTYSGGDRWGDSFAVRGGGANTQILLGSYEDLSGQFGTGPGTNVCILTTEDGMTFTPTTLVITDPTQPGGVPPSGFAYLGVAWGTSNTFWTKAPGFNLRQVQFDLAAGTGTVIQSFSTTAGAGSLDDLDGIGLDVSNNILAGVLTSDTPNDLELFQIPSAGQPPQSYYQAFFPAYNPNLNGNAATTIKFPYIFSLDANNGILALKYSVPLLPVTLSFTNNAGKLVLSYPTVIGHTYQLQSAIALAGISSNTVWTPVGSAINAASSGTQSFTNTSTTAAEMFYRVVSH